MRGFSFLEILLVLIGIAILGMTALNYFGHSSKQSQDIVGTKAAEEAVRSSISASKKTDAVLQDLKSKLEVPTR
jgi:Tfp pilus assembly protein PilO